MCLLVHSELLRTRIADVLLAPAASTTKALENLIPVVNDLAELIQARTTSLAVDSKNRDANLAEAVAKLESACLEFRGLWTKNGSSNESRLAALADLLRIADSMVEASAELAIPWRIEERLGRLNAGAQMNFDRVTKDWVTNAQIRERIWQQLVQFRFLLSNGLVDESSGLIFKCSTRWWRKMLSWVILIALAIGGSICFMSDPFCLFEKHLKFAGWKINPWYCWILTGVAIQSLLRTMGENRSQGFPPFSEIRDWVHVKEVSIGISILGSMAAAVALAYGTKTPEDVNILSAVSTGYALDNIIKGIAGRIPTLLGSNVSVDALRKRVGL